MHKRYMTVCAILLALIIIDMSIIGYESKQTPPIEEPQVEQHSDTQAYTEREIEQEDRADFDIVEPESTQEQTLQLEQEIQQDTEYTTYFTEKDVITLAKVLYRESRVVKSYTRIACVGWTACNRVDAGYADTVYEVLTAPHQFAWFENTQVDDDLYWLACDILTRWSNEKNGMEDVGRVLPREYLYFHGDGRENHFRIKFKSDGSYWDYSLPSPYSD